MNKFVSLSLLVGLFFFASLYLPRGNNLICHSPSSSSSSSSPLDLRAVLPEAEEIARKLSLKADATLAYAPPSSLHPSFVRDASFAPPIDFETVQRWGLANFVHQGILTIAIANAAHLNLARNLVANLERVGHPNRVFFICLDEEACKGLKSHGFPAEMIPTSWLGGSLKDLVSGGNLTKEGTWGGAGSHYFAITHFKSAVMYQLLVQGFTVLFTDLDLAFPRPGGFELLVENFEKMPELFFQVSLEAPKPAFLAPYVNSGFYVARPHPVMIRFFELVTANQLERPNVVDQFIFNEAMDLLGLKINGARRHNVLFLDHLLFCNGYYYFVHKTPHKKGIVPFMVHANYLAGGKAGKEGHLYEAGLWFLEPPV